MTGGPKDTILASPLHPGWILRERILPGLCLAVSHAARELGVARQTFHRIPAGIAAISPEMATRPARLSGTRPHFWLARQQRYGLWHAPQALAIVLGLTPAHTLPAAVQKEVGFQNDR